MRTVKKDNTHRSRVPAAVAGGAVLALLATNARAADVTLPPISVGAGLITSYNNDNAAASGGSSSSNHFNLDSIRLYLGGSVTDTIKLTFDTEYSQGDNSVKVLDGIARFEFSPVVNIWAGRFLPPSDRANLAGPYYADDLFPFAGGVADFYPSVATGRDNGVAYWGQFDIIKVQLGVFDGTSASGAAGGGIGNNKLITAARIMADFWDPENGYYLNGTYYGEKNVLALGVAVQNQGSDTSEGGSKGGTAYSIDGIVEKNLGTAGVVNGEAEYQHDTGLINSSSGWSATASYLFPTVVGIGKFQVLGKYVDKTTHGTVDFTGKTKEVNLNYVIKGFNARVGLYYLNSEESAGSTARQIGAKLQLQM
jgi:hypothetical protein